MLRILLPTSVRLGGAEVAHTASVSQGGLAAVPGPWLQRDPTPAVVTISVNNSVDRRSLSLPVTLPFTQKYFF